MSRPWPCTALCEQGKGQELLFATTPTPFNHIPSERKTKYRHEGNFYNIS